MPTIEPKVLNSEKEQIVPTFNKNEIVKIVNDAIDAGLIDVQQGGGSTETELKKYTVTASDFIVENNRYYATDEFFAILTSKEYYLECDTTLIGGDGHVLYLYPSFTIPETSLILVYATSFSIDESANFSSGLIVSLNTKEVTISDNTFNQVVANPIDADPSDTPLTGVKIGDLNYSIPSGGGGGSSLKFYKHSIETTTVSGWYFDLITNTADLTDSPFYIFAFVVGAAPAGYNAKDVVHISRYYSSSAYRFHLICAKSDHTVEDVILGSAGSFIDTVTEL